jgi:hypothetical protein
MRIDAKVLVIAFVFSVIIGILADILIHLDLFVISQTGFYFWLNVLGVANFVVNPLLAFVAFYFAGGKIDIEAKFVSVIVSLFLGILVGFWIGFLPEIYFSLNYYGGIDKAAVLIQIDQYSYYGSFLLLFFVAFSALCFQYFFRKTRNASRTS